jgi:ABC-type sulfate transport system permease component
VRNRYAAACGRVPIHSHLPGGLIMILIFSAFRDLLFYPLYQINIEDSFMGILCGMLFITWIFCFLIKVLESLIE